MTVQTPSLASEFTDRSHHALGHPASAGQFSRRVAQGAGGPLLIVSGIRQPSILGALRAVAVDDDMLYYSIHTPGHLLDAVSSLGGAKLNALPDGRSVMIKEYIDVKKRLTGSFYSGARSAAFRRLCAIFSRWRP